jgi:hypothetical protein
MFKFRYYLLITQLVIFQCQSLVFIEPFPLRNILVKSVESKLIIHKSFQLKKVFPLQCSTIRKVFFYNVWDEQKGQQPSGCRLAVLGSTRRGCEFEAWVKKKTPCWLFITTVVQVSWAPCGASEKPTFRAFSQPGQEEIILSNYIGKTI